MLKLSHLAGGAALVLAVACSGSSDNGTSNGDGGSVSSAGASGSAHAGAANVNGGGSVSAGGMVASGGSSAGTGPSAAGTTNVGGSVGQAGGGIAGAVGSGGSGGHESGVGGTTAGSGGSLAAAGSGGLGAAGTSGAGGAGGASPGMSAGCGKMPTIQKSQYNSGSLISITAANLQRRYILNVPTNYDNTKPYRLIIAFHQLDGNDKQMYANGYYHLLNLSNNSAIFVAPDGQKNGAPCAGTGNGESGCGWPNPNGSDLALADAVVAQIEENFCVDTDRIFVTGWSYGGSMSYKTSCERPKGGSASWYVRAAAVYSGAQLSGTCTPTKPVAYYASHGTNDTVLNYDLGLGLFQNFAKANGCTYVVPTKVTSGNHVCTSMMGCAAGYPSEFCSFNGPHTPDPSDGGPSWEYPNVWNFISQF